MLKHNLASSGAKDDHARSSQRLAKTGPRTTRADARRRPAALIVVAGGKGGVGTTTDGRSAWPPRWSDAVCGPSWSMRPAAAARPCSAASSPGTAWPTCSAERARWPRRSSRARAACGSCPAFGERTARPMPGPQRRADRLLGRNWPPSGPRPTWSCSMPASRSRPPGRAVLAAGRASALAVTTPETARGRWKLMPRSSDVAGLPPLRGSGRSTVGEHGVRRGATAEAATAAWPRPAVAFWQIEVRSDWTISKKNEKGLNLNRRPGR